MAELYLAVNDAGGVYYRTSKESISVPLRNWAAGGVGITGYPADALILVFCRESEALHFLARFKLPGAHLETRRVTEEDRDEFGSKCCFVERDEGTKEFTFRTGTLPENLEDSNE